jgi:hypothetical protein
LAYENERIPDEVHLYAASLENPSDVKPSRHVFVEEQLPWLEIADRLPRFVRQAAAECSQLGMGRSLMSVD